MWSRSVPAVVQILPRRCSFYFPGGGEEELKPVHADSKITNSVAVCTYWRSVLCLFGVIFQGRAKPGFQHRDGRGGHRRAVRHCHAAHLGLRSPPGVALWLSVSVPSSLSVALCLPRSLSVSLNMRLSFCSLPLPSSIRGVKTASDSAFFPALTQNDDTHSLAPFTAAGPGPCAAVESQISARGSGRRRNIRDCGRLHCRHGGRAGRARRGRCVVGGSPLLPRRCLPPCSRARSQAPGLLFLVRSSSLPPSPPSQTFSSLSRCPTDFQEYE